MQTRKRGLTERSDLRVDSLPTISRELFRYAPPLNAYTIAGLNYTFCKRIPYVHLRKLSFLPDTFRPGNKNIYHVSIDSLDGCSIDIMQWATLRYQNKPRANGNWLQDIIVNCKFQFSWYDDIVYFVISRDKNRKYVKSIWYTYKIPLEVKIMLRQI